MRLPLVIPVCKCECLGGTMKLIWQFIKWRGEILVLGKNTAMRIMLAKG